jgi:hypothetical protein
MVYHSHHLFLEGLRGSTELSIFLPLGETAVKSCKLTQVADYRSPQGIPKKALHG